ncbi:MAG: 4-hydroxythreonine-4-phosphate dehydrogenase PdxA [Candidatus Omnitrophota bacterium]|jgi:4-hydroxythreonine-4-phosphate dehydrogenase
MSSKTSLISNSIKVGITIGDPSGIGPAVILKALNELKGFADFTIIGDNWVLSRVPKVQKFISRYGGGPEESKVKFNDLNNVDRRRFSFGRIRAEYGRASIEYLDFALGLLKKKQIDCLVTAPISKEAVNLAGFNYSGHTEYFIRNTGVSDVVMMLINDKLRFSLATRHLALSKVASNLNKHKLYNNILLTYRSLRKVFGIKNPRIVVCGINPHASDNGLIGKEENTIIKPCLKEIRKVVKAGIEGPLPSDIAISRAADGQYDCVVAIYHDQALIPLKLTSAESGVNLTLGLPFIRTSPLHGTAFDIANNSKLADPSSLIAAIRLAVKCALNLKRA